MDKKFPKIPHLPWSDGISNDDKVILSTDQFSDIVATEKLDGENTTMTRETIHARSLDSDMSHPSRTWVKNLWAQIQFNIPEGFRICGENMFAKHSIYYDALPTYFFVFGIFNAEGVYLSWTDVYGMCEKLGLTPVPTFFKGTINPIRLYPDTHRVLIRRGSYYAKEISMAEGYVIRQAGAITEANFSTSIAKYVRANHVQTDEHWMYTAQEKNGLRNER